MNKRGGKTAADIVNEYDESRLADIIYLYGELKQSRKIAASILRARAEKPILTTRDLLAATQRCFPGKGRRRMSPDCSRLSG